MLYPEPVRLGILAPTLLLCLAVACAAPSDAPRGAEGGTAAAASPSPVEAVPAKSEPEAASRPRGRPLPAFSGWTLDDERLEISSLIGKRLVVTFFNPEVENAVTVTRALNAIAPLRGKHNFEIVGIATGAQRKAGASGRLGPPAPSSGRRRASRSFSSIASGSWPGNCEYPKIT
jgi:hypothetical protein